MNYDEVTAALFATSLDEMPPPPTVGASAARRLRDAVEPIAMHPVWARSTNEALAAEGLDFFGAYTWGRAAALGEPSTGVVVSSFGVFEPGRIGGAYEAGRAACTRERLLAIRFEATTGSLGAVLSDAGVAETDVADVADRLKDAVFGLGQAGRPLYAGLVGIPMSDAPAEVLWRSAEMIREHRGDSHIAACVAAGLEPIAMNILTELWVGYPLGEYSGSRGWAPKAIAAAAERLRAQGLLVGDELTAEGLAFRERIENATDTAQAELIGRLGDDLDGLLPVLDRWSALCVEAGYFPPSGYKRAAG